MFPLCTDVLPPSLREVARPKAVTEGVPRAAARVSTWIAPKSKCQRRADVGIRPYANYEAICKIRSCQQRRARVSPPYAEGSVFASKPKFCVGRGAPTPPRIPHRLSCNAVRALIERPPPAPQRIIPIRAVGTPHFLLFHYYLLLSTASGGGGIVFLAMCTKFGGQILRCGGEKMRGTS